MKRNCNQLALFLSLCLGFCSFEWAVSDQPATARFVPARNVTSDPVPNPAIRRLLDIQKKVQTVAAENMEATVAITDGIGFGSGIIVNDEGLILTAAHVMSTGREYDIIFPSGRRAKARPLGRNLDVDAGMMQITTPGPWPQAEIGDSRDLNAGDWTVVLGHSGGFELGRKPPVRAGKILKRRANQFVTDGVLIGGDSGGPLFDLDGRVIGIHSSIGENVAENRHITIATFREHWDRMLAGDSWGALPDLDGKPVRRPKLGVTVDHSAGNARIINVRPNSPADRIGIKTGDVVVGFDNITIRSSRQLVELIRRKEVGDICPIIVERAGAILELQVHLNQ